jgi:tRNA U34 5-methylaminomethyl-2-thiouridine-forming methyltransferase MnmC
VENIQLILTSDGSSSLLNLALNETYHSTHGAVQESLHVFIKNGLRYWLDKSKAKEVSIFEVGFGTGLNSLLTLKESTDRNVMIRYTAVEAFPVSLDVIGQLNYPQQINFESNDYFRQLHQCEWNRTVSISSNFVLEKHEGKIQEMRLSPSTYDLIFFDAFAPGKQPDMWELPILEKISNAMKPGGVFVTYCAKGQLKRDLKSLGMIVESLAGPPGKREMVQAAKR